MGATITERPTGPERVDSGSYTAWLLDGSVKLQRKQARELQKNLDAIKRKNPPAPKVASAPTQWLVLKDGRAFGYLSARTLDAVERLPIDATVEVTVNLFEPLGVSGPKLVLRWLAGIQAGTLIARVFSTNRAVKRLLQRGGFALLGRERGVETYGVQREHFLAVTQDLLD